MTRLRPAVTRSLLALALAVAGLTLVQGQKPAAPPRRIAVFGSSVANGTGDDLGKEGYTGRLRELLAPRGWEVLNQSRGGDNTRTMAPRFAPDGAPDPKVRYLLTVNPSYVLLGLSLGNEGIQNGTTKAEKDVIYDQFEAGMRGFVARSREHHIVPIITLCYTRNDFTPVEYEYTRRMNLTINAWDVPSVNFLGAVDDGTGKWAKGFWHDSLHPNAAGHDELLRTFVPTLFEAIEQGKPAPKRSTATGFARVEGGATALSLTPDAAIHSFALGVTVRATREGSVASISGSTLTAAMAMKTEQRGGGRGALEFETTTLTTAEPFLATIGVQGGVWVYKAANGTIVRSEVKADARPHRVILSHYTARGESLFFIDGTLAGAAPERLEPKSFALGGPGESDFRDLLIYRSALNADEVAALEGGRLLQASLEVYAPLAEATFPSGGAVVNLAQSLTSAKVGAGSVQHIDNRGDAVADFLRDLKHSLRMFRQTPGFTIAAVAALTLGIGANTAIFSVVNSVLLKPLPFPDPERLVLFLNTSPNGAGPGGSVPKFNVWRQQTSVVQDASAYRFGVMNLTGGDNPEQLASGQVTGDFFRLFGAQTAAGRTFTADEDRPNGGKVVVLSYGFWQRRFGGDPQRVGKTISLGGEPYEVVGVLASSFTSAQFDPLPDVWTPFQMDPASTDQANYFTAAARLKPDVTLAMADTQMKAAAEQFRALFPNALGPRSSFSVQPLQERMVRNVRTSLLVLVGAVSFVLLIACANVANLLLVRATARRREIAIRAAMGAARGRIVRQLLTENVLLSLVGGTLGLALGVAGIRALLAVNPGNIPRIGQDGSGVSADWRVVAFTMTVSLVTGVVFGLFPALQASRADLNLTLKESSGQSGSGFRQNKARSILVVVEVALALVLLVGASLLIRSFMALRAVNPGFVSHNVLTMRMSLTEPRYAKSAGVDQLIRAGLERVRGVPGVEAVSTTCCVPLEGGYGLPFEIVGRPVEASANNGAGWYTISAGYFDVFRIPILRGRDFTDRDAAGAGGVVIINQAMARQFWPQGDPLSDQLVIGKGVGPAFVEGPRQIIGIVGDVRDGALNQDPQPAMYVPFAQVPDGVTALNSRLTALGWVVRTRAEPHAVSLAIQKELREASGGLPVARIKTMDEIVVQSTARSDFNMLLLTVFGCAALLLAAIGVYGLMSYSVEQRTQEIGIRLALGAELGQVRNMVIVQGMSLAVAGVAIGTVSAFALSRLIETLLFGVTARDPVVFVAVPGVLTLVALVAVWLPALRATRIDPIDALRCE